MILWIYCILHTVCQSVSLCMWLINICILYLFDSFYFLYMFTFEDVIYLRRSSWHITLEFTMVCLCASIFPLCSSAVRTVICLHFWIQFLLTTCSGGERESWRKWVTMPAGKNFPVQVCTSCLQFALCHRCVLTNQSLLYWNAQQNVSWNVYTAVSYHCKHI